jgi:hypothetical protein
MILTAETRVSAPRAREFHRFHSTGNGCSPTAMSIHEGIMVAAPRCPHFVQRRFRRSMSLHVSGPHRMTNGTNGSGRRCEQSRLLQSAQNQPGERLS